MQKCGRTQTRIYTYIVSFIKEHSYPPTVREIGAAVGLRSTSTVHTHLHNLVSKGMITMDRSRQRSISLCADEERGESARRVPLIGSVAAGTPILAVENIESYYSFSPSILRGAEGENFMLKVHGSSMIEAGIMDGDLVILNSALSFTQGDIVVARIGAEEVTLKRLFYEKDGRIRLQPENSAMEPIFVFPDEIEIVGKLVGLYRRY